MGLKIGGPYKEVKKKKKTKTILKNRNLSQAMADEAAEGGI